MRILLTGRTGQVGRELERALAPLGDLVATDRASLDLADRDSIRRVVRDVKPEVIVNAAAYTAVDRAEAEPELAMRVNGEAPGVLGEEAKRLGALLVHYSTDYVFDGEKATPYVEEDAPNPLNAYGRGKLHGERAVRESGCAHLVLRTSWVYSARGRNFMRSILEAARTRPELRVVDDQLGSPTSAAAIARATASMLSDLSAARDRSGLYHLSASGETTWFGFAREILRASGSRTPVVPIRSDEYPAAARRPRNSRLDCAKVRGAFGVVLGAWDAGLAAVLSPKSSA